MKSVIVNGSIQHKNSSLVVSAAIGKVFDGSEVCTLDSFNNMFAGKYINLKNANSEQKKVLESMSSADYLIFVVPTYYKSMPGVLKNFFDIVRDKKVFAKKTVAIVANNYKNQDYGAQHAMQVIAGMSIFYDELIYIVPEILIVHHENIDYGELNRFKKVIENYHKNR